MPCSAKALFKACLLLLILLPSLCQAKLLSLTPFGDLEAPAFVETVAKVETVLGGETLLGVETPSNMQTQATVEPLAASQVTLPAAAAEQLHAFPDLALHQVSALLVGGVAGVLALVMLLLALSFVNLRGRRRWPQLILVLSALLGLELWLEHFIDFRYQQNQFQQVEHRLGVVAAKTERVLHNNLALIKGMSTAISANPDLSYQEFELYAKRMLGSEPLLKYFAAAPDLIVRYAYPLDGSEEVLGLDYRQHPNQHKEVLKAKVIRALLLSGPIDFAQGGQGFIGRAPVFYSDMSSGETVFWGIVSAPMDAERVYQAGGLFDLAESHSVALAKQQGTEREVFWGDPALFGRSLPQINIQVGEQSWFLTAKAKYPPVGMQNAINGLRLAFVLLLLLGVVLIIWRSGQYRERLKLLSQLRYRERMLSQVGRIASVGGFEYEVDKGFVYASKEIYKILGIPFRKDLNAVSIFALFDQGDKKLLLGSMEQLSKQSTDVSLELKLHLEDGREKWIAVQAYSEFSVRGRITIKGAIQNVTERKKSELTILRQANYDPLTELPNRSMFDNQLNSAVASASRSGEIFALLFLDLDRFKDVNDSLGHAVGDRLLQMVAVRLRDCIRESDTLSRRSGDEFTLIAAQIKSAASVEVVAGKIIHALKQPFYISGHQIYVTSSIGITVFPDDAETAAELLKNADQAMYSAKEQGRNRYCYYTARMQSDADNRLRLHMDLIDAIENQQFEVVYQPILDLQRGEICEVEALLRWQHPKRGFIRPDKFIPLAEDVGLIAQLGEISMRTAIKDILAINKLTGLDIGLSLNKSYREFFGPAAGEEPWLKALLSPAERPPITIEITESILMEDDKVYQIMGQLRSAGVKIAIDDFGTGYSSLSYLRRFPVDWLKIDRSFVHEIDVDHEDLALVESILAMAQKLGLQVVAEGVETAQQLNLLQMHNCDMAQGYYFARPMSLPELRLWLAERYPSRGHNSETMS